MKMNIQKAVRNIVGIPGLIILAVFFVLALPCLMLTTKSMWDEKGNEICL